jgi:hypothetical protein
MVVMVVMVVVGGRVMRCWQRLCALSCTAPPAIPRAVSILTGKGFVAEWLGVLHWRGNVRPKCEGSISVDMKLLFVLSKTRAVRFVRWNPVESSDYESGQIPVIPVEISMIIPTGIVLHRENYIQKIVHRIPEIPENPAGLTGIRPE